MFGICVAMFKYYCIILGKCVCVNIRTYCIHILYIYVCLYYCVVGSMCNSVRMYSITYILQHLSI